MFSCCWEVLLLLHNGISKRARRGDRDGAVICKDLRGISHQDGCAAVDHFRVGSPMTWKA